MIFNLNISNTQLNIPIAPELKTSDDNEPVSAETGISMPFSANSNNSELSPLLVNLNTNPAANNALRLAGLTVDSRNITMVNAMMREGMNIAKNDVQAMNSALKGLGEADISNAVLLTKLGISPSPENLKQYSAYEGFEHQVSLAVNEIMDMIPSTISDMINSGNADNAINMTEDLLNLYTGQGTLYPMDEHTSLISGMDVPVTEIMPREEVMVLGQLLTDAGIDNAFSQVMADGGVSLSDTLFVINNLLNVSSDDPIYSSLIGDGNGPAEELVMNDPSINIQSSESMVSHIGQELESDVDVERSPDLTSTATNNTQDALSNIHQNHQKAILDLLRSKPMSSLLKSAINSQWKLTPEQVGDEKQVSTLYKRMTEHTNRILDILHSNIKEEAAPIVRQTTELTQNLNFMNELNNMFNYVQLPMRMSGNDAHGELYVYSNKKHMASEDGTVSALLHLDMDNLGPTDVYVTMNSSSHVNTHFYLQDDISLELIADHIDELNERIEKRGYTCTAQISTKDEMTNVMNEIVKDNRTNIPISITSFDARA